MINQTGQAMLRSLKFLIGTSLGILTTLYGSNCPCPEEPCCRKKEKIESHRAYNAPSRIAVDECINVFAEATFTYWIPTQENMELGFVRKPRFSSPGVPFGGSWVNSDFEYKPGFKVFMGVNLDRDHWDLRGGYTWFRAAHTTSKTLDSSGDSSISPRFTVPSAASSYFFKAKQSWRLEMDIGDLALARHYWVGSALTFHPFLGLRSAWIRQDLKNNYFDEVTDNLAHEQIFIHERTHAWSIGPRLGVDMNWDLGCGFRLYGVGAGDLLFTRYSSLKFDQDAFDSGVLDGGSSYSFRQKNLAFLRHHLDLELGFGWGSYFTCDKWHFDLRTGYVFEAFFDQNMFRTYLDNAVIAKSTCPHGNLYIHGLNVRARFDF